MSAAEGVGGVLAATKKVLIFDETLQNGRLSHRQMFWKEWWMEPMNGMYGCGLAPTADMGKEKLIDPIIV